MQKYFAALAAAALLTPALAAQALTYDDFAWTFSGSSTSSGFVTSELLHVTGPSYDFCSNELAVFTTTAPFAGTVRAHLQWTIFDICHFDWPVYVVNGEYVQIPVAGRQLCFLPGSYDLEFDVQAGDVFGLGVGSSDCFDGPGVADFTEFSLLPPAWTDVGGALDPRVELDIAGPATFDNFGSSLATIGDVDGDGLDDVVIAGSSNSSQYAITVSAYSGADGAGLWARTDPFAYGTNLVTLGDVDADGFSDVAVSNSAEGSVRMLSGTDGRVRWTWTSGSPAAEYGRGLAAHADIDGDGVLDLAVGANSASNPPVRILSGASGVELALIQAGPGDSRFGRTLGTAADLDGDGAGELMVAAFGVPARVRVFSGSTGAQLFELHSPSPYDTAWNYVQLIGVGDWNGDGTPDVAVGAAFDVPSPPNGGSGTVTIFSGATGDVLLVLQASVAQKNFGYALAGEMDVDGDGAFDLAIGVPEFSGVLQPKGGRIQVLRAPDGALLQEILSPPTVHLGAALDWQGGASLPTLAVGMPADTEDGRVRLYSDLQHPAGAPVLSMYGALLDGTPWFVRLEHALPGNLAILVIGVSAPGVPFKGGVLVPSPHRILPVMTDATGAFEFGANAPSALMMATNVWLQAWMPDPAGLLGWSATRALKSPPP